MGIDIVLFRAKKLKTSIVKKLEHQDIDEMLENYNFDYINEQTYTKHEQDYKELSPYLTPVLMKRTFTDREKYMAAAGIPVGLTWYSQTSRGDYTLISYEENGERKTVQISHEDMHKFDYVKEEIYYVYHKEHIDVEVYYSIRDIVWNVINKNMQALHHDDKSHTYSPHRLTPKEAMEILKGIAKEYKADEIYVSDDSVPFIMELLVLEDKNVFIMGEN